MNQDLSKMYKFLEALNIGGSLENSLKNKKELNTRDKQIDSAYYQRSKKCDDQCIDCFLIFCQK